jgi:DNA-binding GntR family transcriptional regulator
MNDLPQSLLETELTAALRKRTGPVPTRLLAIVRHLRAAGGEMRLGPDAIATLAGEYGVQRAAVRKAIADLRRKGVVEVYTQPKQKMLRYVFDPAQPALPFGHAD